MTKISGRYVVMKTVLGSRKTQEAPVNHDWEDVASVIFKALNGIVEILCLVVLNGITQTDFVPKLNFINVYSSWKGIFSIAYLGAYV